MFFKPPFFQAGMTVLSFDLVINPTFNILEHEGKLQCSLLYILRCACIFFTTLSMSFWHECTCHERNGKPRPQNVLSCKSTWPKMECPSLRELGGCMPGSNDTRQVSFCSNM